MGLDAGQGPGTLRPEGAASAPCSAGLKSCISSAGPQAFHFPSQQLSAPGCKVGIMELVRRKKCNVWSVLSIQPGTW